MITEIDSAHIALRADYNDCRQDLQNANTTIDILEKQIAELKATISKQAIDLEFALKDKEELENALKFKPIYA